MDFGGTDLSGASYDLTQLMAIKSPFMPPVKNEHMPVGHRAYDFGGFLQPRTITVKASVTGSNAADLLSNLDNISRVLNPQLGEKALVLDFPNDDRYWNCRVKSAIDWNIIKPTLARGIINFIASDPCAYSTSQTDTYAAITTDPQTLTVTPTGSTAYVYPQYQLFVTTGHSYDVTIENDETGDTLDISGDWNYGDTYNFYAHNMYCDSLVSGYIDDITGQWPYLLPNQANDIIITGMANRCTLHVIYRNRYL